MNTTKTRRILRITPVALALALGLGACGAVPCLAGNNGSAPISNSGVTSNGAGTSNGTVNSGGSQPLASGSTSGGLSGYSGGISGGSAAGSTGQVGVSGGTPGVSDPASGMSPDQVAQLCKVSDGLDDPDGYMLMSYWGMDVKILNDMKPYIPVQLQPNINVLVTDYTTISNRDRLPSQLMPEMKAAYKPLADFRKQICK